MLIQSGLCFTDTEPVCTINLSGSITDGDQVTLSCDVTYTTNISPLMMTWTDSQGQPVVSNTNRNQTDRITSSIGVRATAPSLAEYTCTSYFSAPTGLPSTASNTPEYRHVWTSPVITVLGWLITISCD